MNPSFNINLNQKILKNQVTIGKYDGKNPCLTCSTISGKVFIHSPHIQDLDENQIKFLNINKDVTSILSGTLNFKNKKDILLVGTSTNLLAYDVENNCDIFYKEISEGLNTINLGRINQGENNFAIIGCNYAIKGFDEKGEEKFWTTTGGNVTSVIMNDFDDDNVDELIVGSDDYNIYVYRNDENISEITENDEILNLCNLKKTFFGFALKNGSIGIYQKEKKIWKKKTKFEINSLIGFDINSDGIDELISGFSNGRLEIRNEKDGRLIMNQKLNSPISGFLKYDYRLDGREQLICCCYNGDVRGYLPINFESKLKQIEINKEIDEKIIEQLNQKKNELLFEIKNYEENILKLSNGECDSNLIDPKTKVNCKLKPNHDKKCIDIVFESEKDTKIKSAIVFSDIFENESKIIYSEFPSNNLIVSLSPERNMVIELRIQILVGHELGTKFHVFELNYKMPKFALFVPVVNLKEEPQSKVVFNTKERKERIILWLNTNFNIVLDSLVNEKLNLKFYNLRTGETLRIILNENVNIEIYSNSLESCGDIVQDFGNFFKINELETQIDFPQDFEKIKNLLDDIDKYNSTRLKMIADMADNSQAIKNLVIKAEDSRIIGDYKNMKKIYMDLYNLNKDLINEQIKRTNNQQQLLNALKEVNKTIEFFSRTRIGKTKSNIVSQSKLLIKKRNFSALIELLKTGKIEIKKN